MRDAWIAWRKMSYRDAHGVFWWNGILLARRNILI